MLSTLVHVSINRNGRQPEKVSINGCTGSHAAANVCNIFAEMFIMISPIQDSKLNNSRHSLRQSKSNKTGSAPVFSNRLNSVWYYITFQAVSPEKFYKFFVAKLIHLLRHLSRKNTLIWDGKFSTFSSPNFEYPIFYTDRANLHIMWVNPEAVE